ncbi:MAG: hypothetical protein OEY94_04025 [Alphaproteobacteria bacterium]|nr:hypothetical protein [Alphaproteobacteria bacterium]
MVRDPDFRQDAKGVCQDARRGLRFFTTKTQRTRRFFAFVIPTKGAARLEESNVRHRRSRKKSIP